MVGGAGNDILSDPAALSALHLDTLLVAALAFAGAYFHTLRLFLRAVRMFDLSPITFLRGYAHMVLAVILTVALYRATPQADAMVAFRLEKSNLYDIQNPATFNPIMLHVESPYGSYATVEWVARAKLCTADGPECFLALQTLGIRTILDPKCAVLGKECPTGRSVLLDTIADILLQDDKRDRDLRSRIGFLHVPALHRPVGKAGAASAEARRAVDCQLVRVMLGDLLVYRLGQLWTHIHVCLTPKKAAEPNEPAVEPDTPTVATASGPDPSELAPGDPSAITVARSPETVALSSGSSPA